MSAVTVSALILAMCATSSPQPTELVGSSVNIRIISPSTQPAAGRVGRFTARFTADELKPLLLANNPTDMLPKSLQVEAARKAATDAIDRVGMDVLVEKLGPFLTKTFPGKFKPERDLIVAPIPAEQQVQIEDPGLPGGRYRGPQEQIIGFLVHDISQQEFINVAVRMMQVARQILDTGNPAYDRSSPKYFDRLAEQEVRRIKQASKQARATAEFKEQVRRRIGKALGIYDQATEKYSGKPNWIKEWRRFPHVVKDGKFIARLQPLVDTINRDLTLAGFAPPRPADRPGIYFDTDLGEVEIILPKPMMEEFIERTGRLERQMAEDNMISIEVVRLTDREIIEGAIASRFNLLSQGVHDVNRLENRWLIRQLGINPLIAVANRELSIVNLRQIEAGAVPAGTAAVQLVTPDMPFPSPARTVTNLGSDISLGADDIFFDGREQSYGFSYIGPDGLEHRLSLDVVDSLREFWDRIERNLIVHKINKTDKPHKFTVPVGPDTRTFEGIAALISQEDREVVIVSEEGGLVHLSATAGTWLIIQDFQIVPKPGTSTVLTEAEREQIEDRVLMTMLLRDPVIDVDVKASLVEAPTRKQLHTKLRSLYKEHADRAVRNGIAGRTWESIYQNRRQQTLEDAAVEKKERNSKIKLTFYSSQGSIIQAGTNTLGDANDLTSFTTELRPNVVTPISSFFTKAASGTKGSSPLTGIAKGEQSLEEKTMSHLVVRVRFPTVERERNDMAEGRYLGYFDLPLGRIPHSTVDLPFLSSSDHPLARLAKLRVGLMFESLQEDKVRQPLDLINPNSLGGTVSLNIWQTATTRMILNRKIVSNCPESGQSLATEYHQRFKIEVRSLLEYDEDFFSAPTIALRNMDHWNNPDRIVLALNNSTGRFALHRLLAMINELGEALVVDDYARDFLARSPKSYFGRHTLLALSVHELTTLRRDVANHYMRFHEIYGDAVMEAVSMIFGLGSYRSASRAELLAGPFRGFHDLVVFDNSSSGITDSQLFKSAHEKFMLLKNGGYKGRLFERSYEHLEDLDKDHRSFIIRGRDILK